ncbi:cation:proton antiporter [Schleiferia thermophila]|jgi:Kef-type K+ transport system membrane component KefB|uniref:Transporter (CPA2 family) n=1 Tax=Schleiferia thermophila TaxID=884107 RepID=A0A368ZYA7_9FLAO|nr:cation:proton antiporter [Schleiferia thermophila]PMB29492.1 cation:proton antiporter [Fischerella thermalis CCMEE 5319]RCX02030.1 transporter (CPA2 family) [Schleiferia thermophila]GCD80553.1 sodium:proton antiporter [Schleiferia thermophila]
MTFLALDTNFSIPLKNPVLIFSLILFIILFAPLLLNKIRIPHLIGLIIAGALIGPNGFYIMDRDSSIILFGNAGLLYIMFLAGLEIDLAEFKKNSGKSLVFGLLTFSIPMILGIFSGQYILKFSLMTSVLLASMYASHTLLTYPLISKFGITKNRAVNITVGGTVITDTMALLVLAVIAGMATGNVDESFWYRLIISVIIFGTVVLVGFPILARWFFKNFDDSISQYIFVLALLFLGAFAAEVAGLEAIIGAFLVGLALNKLIPHTSPLMNRIEFVGNALFIPFFLIGVGMLIDYRVFFHGYETLLVAAVMIVAATSSKFLAAFLTQKIFGFSKDERLVIFGLSNAQAAATLAAVLVGYNIILNVEEIKAAEAIGEVIEPVRLLNDSVLNGTILMILVTCTIASFAAQKGAQALALKEMSNEESDEQTEEEERILIASHQEKQVEELVQLALLIKSPKNKSGLYGLTVVEEYGDEITDKAAKRILEKAVITASGADVRLQDILRYDVNVVNAITGTIKEKKITELILGLNPQKGLSKNFLGNLTEGILAKNNVTTLIYKPAQPLATIKRHLVVVPDKAEKEIGFLFWMYKIWNISKNSGAKVVFYSTENTSKIIKSINERQPINCEFNVFDDWDDFLILSRDVRIDDNIIIQLSRPHKPSYQLNMVKVPHYLNKYFMQNNFILVYPIQYITEHSENLDLKNPSMTDSIEKLDDLGKTIAKIFKFK